jgi:CHASE3 domain sensor protein
VAAAAVSVINAWKSRQMNAKIVENTEITRKGVQNAAIAADAAKSAVVAATVAANETKDALNGRIDQTVEAARQKAYADGFAAGKASVTPNSTPSADK